MVVGRTNQEGVPGKCAAVCRDGTGLVAVASSVTYILRCLNIYHSSALKNSFGHSRPQWPMANGGCALLEWEWLRR